jgi:predicted aspartyl protease
MATGTETQREGRSRDMGQVYTDLELTNASDYFRALAGDIAANQVRSVALRTVLVDTGATHLCLPSDVIAALGLSVSREIPLSTAAGNRTSRIYRGVLVTVAGRASIFDCVELPGGDQALLGVVVLESLGLQPDIINHRLDLRPETGPHGYISAY